MIVKSPERVQKKQLKPATNLTSSYQINGEKRLKSLDSHTSIQNRHLYSYQIYSNKANRLADSSTMISAQTYGNKFKDQSEVNVDQDRLDDDNKERRYGSEGGDMNDQQSNLQTEKQLGNASKKKTKKNQTMQVFVKVRPLNQKELTGKNGVRKTIKVCEDRKQIIINQSECNKNVFSQTVRDDKLFEMNRAFGEECSNEEVFNHIMKDDIKTSLFEGFNCTCFVYGMTGAGKTYTMFGDICNYMTMNSSVKGLILLSLKEINNIIKEKSQQHQFDEIKEDNNNQNSEKQISFRLKLSYLEIYNEQIHDLLSADGENNDNLMVIEDPNRGVFVPELIEQEIISEEQVLDLILLGNTRRQMAATGQNEFSSRSHAIITFQIEQTITNKQSNSDKNNISTNKSTIITTGSERAAVTENRGLRLQEGANINKSLLALGNCINILADTTKKGAFVPYRDSKLTRLLKDSLGGNTQTYMVACVSPAFISFEETLNTLKYAQRARKIEKVVTKNEKIINGLSSSKSLQYISLIENMKKEIDTLKQQLANTPTLNNPQQSLTSTNVVCESQLNLHAQQVGGLLLQREKSSNQISSASDLYPTHQQQPNFYLNNEEPKRSQLLPNGVPCLQLQKQDSTTSSGQQVSGWQESDSFSSSGKSVRISCTNTSNNGSVILFKRSPSQLNFTKQQQIHQQKVTEEIQLLSGKILKNLEENWEILQSIQELNNLRKQNEEIIKEKQQRLKKLKGNLIQWTHESEMNQLQIGISQLQSTMNSNSNILENMKSALHRNEENKVDLQQQMVSLLSNSSDQMFKVISQTCNTLQVEKNDLENANLEIKQQHLHIQSKFDEKVHQIKSMEEQIKLMQRELLEKDQIIQQNKQVIMHLASNPTSSQKHHSNNSSQINITNQQNKNSTQNGLNNFNSNLNQLSSQFLINSGHQNTNSFFLTTISNNGNHQKDFNPFLSQVDQHIQVSQNGQYDQECGETYNGVFSHQTTQTNKNVIKKQITEGSGDYMLNSFLQNPSTIIQQEGTNINNNGQYMNRNNNQSLSNQSAIYATGNPNKHTGKFKDTKRQVSSDANPNISNNKLQLQMHNNLNGNLNQTNMFRSTSSQNTNNKKFFQEKNGYFDFKQKQNQISLNSGHSTSTTPCISTITGYNSLQNSKPNTVATHSSKNATLQTQTSLLVGSICNNSDSPQVRAQSPTLVTKKATQNNIVSNKLGGYSNNNNNNNNSNNINALSSNTAQVGINKASTQQISHQQTFSSPTQSSARLSTIYKNPTSITSSIVNRKSVLTHRDNQQNIQNNSSGGANAFNQVPNNASTINTICSQGNMNGMVNNCAQPNSVSNIGLNSQVSSNNNISSFNNQTNNMSLNINNNSCNNPQGTKLQDARNEYKEFISIFRKIHKDDDDSANIQSITNMQHSDLDEKFKHMNYNQQVNILNEQDLYPNSSTIIQNKECKYIAADIKGVNVNNYKYIDDQLPLDSSPLPKKQVPNKNFLNSNKQQENLDLSISGFLQTDEFPELHSAGKYFGVEKVSSFDKINIASKNQRFEPQSKECSPIIEMNESINPILTTSSIQQKQLFQQLTPLYNSQKPPFQSNSSLQSSAHQQSHSTPPQIHSISSTSSLNKFNQNLVNVAHRKNDSLTKVQQPSNQKESNMVTPEHSVSIHKIDLYKDKERNSSLCFYPSSFNQGSIQKNVDKIPENFKNMNLKKIHRLDNLVLSNNINVDTLKEISDLIQQIQSIPQSTLNQRQNENAVIERFKNLLNEQTQKQHQISQKLQQSGVFQSYSSLSQHRGKSFGLTQKSLNEKENNSINQNKYQSLSPNKKVNHAVQDVIDKQKKKRSQEYQRHLMLSNLASNILNSDSEIDMIQQLPASVPKLQSRGSNHIISTPTNQKNQNEVNGFSLSNASGIISNKSNVININLYQNKNNNETSNTHSLGMSRPINDTLKQNQSKTKINNNQYSIKQSSSVVATSQHNLVESQNTQNKINTNNIRTSNSIGSINQIKTQSFTNNFQKAYNQSPLHDIYNNYQKYN